VALVENGTHVLFGARLGRFAEGDGEDAHPEVEQPAVDRAPGGQ
jgi:hypothetical protein